MGIGLVIFIWLLFFAGIAIIYLTLHILSKSFYLADVLKDAFKALISAVACLIVFGLFLVFLNYIVLNVYPVKIFTDNFQFNPTSDVEILEGSFKIFAERSLGRISLKFRADGKTIEKIAEKRSFYKTTGKNFTDAADGELRKLSADENNQFYRSDKFASDCDPDNGNCHAYLVHNKLNNEAYFSW